MGGEQAPWQALALGHTGRASFSPEHLGGSGRMKISTLVLGFLVL